MIQQTWNLSTSIEPGSSRSESDILPIRLWFYHVLTWMYFRTKKLQHAKKKVHNVFVNFVHSTLHAQPSTSSSLCQVCSVPVYLYIAWTLSVCLYIKQHFCLLRLKYHKSFNSKLPGRTVFVIPNNIAEKLTANAVNTLTETTDIYPQVLQTCTW